jgi:hypothetical protein
VDGAVSRENETISRWNEPIFEEKPAISGRNGTISRWSEAPAREIGTISP